MMQQLKEAVDHIQSKVDFQPQFGIILGTGLGNLVNDIEVHAELEYEFIPHFPVSTVEGHKGRLIFGLIGSKRVVAMQGRFHYYEGYTMQQVVFPVRVMKLLGIEKLFISNAAGSINENINEGDLMIIEDHINLQPSNPLVGANIDELGSRFPDMSEPYSAGLRKKALDIATTHNYPCHSGVYVSVPGPNLETKAEYLFLNRIGADAVGMSTVPEVLAAVHCGLEIFAISVITDKNMPISEVSVVTVAEVIKIAKEAEPKMTHILRELIEAC